MDEARELRSESGAESREDVARAPEGTARGSGRGSSGELPQDTQREYDEYVWMRHAALAGITGAFIVAVFFLGVDLLSGRPPLWTPALLGSALFLDESIAADADPTTMLPLVIGYTVLHGVVFFAFAIGVGSSRLAIKPAEPFTPWAAIRVALLLFVGLELMFLALGWVVGSEVQLAPRLGFGWISLANALAAIGMTGVIEWGARQLAARARSGPGGAG